MMTTTRQKTKVDAPSCEDKKLKAKLRFATKTAKSLLSIILMLKKFALEGIQAGRSSLMKEMEANNRE